MQSDLESEGLTVGRGCISKMSDGRRLPSETSALPPSLEGLFKS